MVQFKERNMTEKQIEQRRNAGRKGGLAVFNKYGSEYMRQIGKKGAEVFHSIYYVQPVGIRSWVIVGRKDNKIITIF